MSTDNLLHTPGDLQLLGHAAFSGAQISVKAYHHDGYAAYTAAHSDSSFLLVDNQGKPRVVKNGDIKKSEFKPAICHSINCVIRADYFQSKEFIEKFNYMQK